MTSKPAEADKSKDNEPQRHESVQSWFHQSARLSLGCWMCCCTDRENNKKKKVLVVLQQRVLTKQQSLHERASTGRQFRRSACIFSLKCDRHLCSGTPLTSPSRSFTSHVILCSLTSVKAATLHTRVLLLFLCMF